MLSHVLIRPFLFEYQTPAKVSKSKKKSEKEKKEVKMQELREAPPETNEKTIITACRDRLLYRVIRCPK
jgi:hypothetical protein